MQGVICFKAKLVPSDTSPQAEPSKGKGTTVGETFYNPFAYLESEKHLLKQTSCLLCGVYGEENFKDSLRARDN